MAWWNTGIHYSRSHYSNIPNPQNSIVVWAGINRLSNNRCKSAIVLPLDGEVYPPLAAPEATRGLGGGVKLDIESVSYFITLPLIPSSPRPLPARRAYRPEGRLYEPEAVEGRRN
jgi:hypothetical protein